MQVKWRGIKKSKSYHRGKVKPIMNCLGTTSCQTSQYYYKFHFNKLCIAVNQMHKYCWALISLFVQAHFMFWLGHCVKHHLIFADASFNICFKYFRVFHFDINFVWIRNRHCNSYISVLIYFENSPMIV